MAVNFEDTVFGFDLNYLHQTTDYNLLQGRIEKQRMAILKAKKKTVCTDSLIRKYHEKQQSLEEIEKDYLASKEECKQICIEYKNSLEKCSKLEVEAKSLQTKNHELENDLRTAINQQEALRSHSNQLQILIKDYETQLEALKIENQLEKIKPKNNEKKVGCIAKDNSELMKHVHVILDLALKNKNLSGKDKRLLKKYKKLYKLGESAQDAEDSEDETDTFDTYECNENTELDAHTHTQKGEIFEPNGKPECKVVEIDRVSNASNEIVSIDTGRGSSLAFSDSDKCFHSPEYFSDDSPLSVDSLSNKKKKSYANKATSPISSRTNNAALSPVKELQILHGFEKQITDVNRNEIATSPVQFNDRDVSCEENREDYRDSNNLSDDENSNDCEIETILSSMRLNHNLITPIPRTPSKSRTSTVSISEHSQHVCLEAAKVREENKTLQANLTNLTKEVINIKSMLKLHFMSSDSGTGHNNYLCAPSDDYTPSIHENKAAQIFISNEEPIFDPHSDNESQCSIASLDTVVNEFPSVEADAFVNESSEIDHESSNLLVIDDAVPINASRNLLFEEDPETNEVLDNLNNNNNLNISINEGFDTLPQIGKKNMRKLTKLQRLRINMLPKGKIPKARSIPQRKLRMKPKQLKIRKKKKPSKTDSSATLNDKEVYEKAVKVMAEIKSKKCIQKETQLTLKEANNDASCVIDVNSNKNNDDSSDIDVNSNKNLVSKAKKKIVEIDSEKDQNLEYDNTSIQCTDTVNLTPKAPITTRSQSKQAVNEAEVSVKQIHTENIQDGNNVGSFNEGDKKFTSNNSTTQEETREKRKYLKRPSLDKPEIENKRVLRSSAAHLALNNSSRSLDDSKQSDKSECKEGQTNNSHRSDASAITNYSDLDVFTEEPTVKTTHKTQDAKEYIQDDKARNQQGSILCEMLEKYGAVKAKNRNKKISESAINSMCKKIQDGIGEIIELPANETKSAMNALVERLRKCQLKQLLMGLMNYLKDPARKVELFSKVYVSSAPPMTKSEQVLLYILTNLQGNWPGVDFIGCVLDNMEYTLFKLNHTPEFETIESMSHFYAVLCRYMKDKSRLRLFILDAMYCIQFKAVPLIKQCMEVWMHILPLAHLGIAKSPLVMCVVYLLHFFKCEDRFNRVTEIRNILSRKYFYKFSDWNETKILEMFRSSIKELKNDKIETKMLRLALIVLAKRQGPQWCQNNIIKNLLQPMIEDQNAPEKVKVFCLSMIGPLLKPYPKEMKVHCEVVINQLNDLINSTSSICLQEAIFTSLIYMSKHNHNRVVRALLSWSPKHVSPEMESILKGYVRDKPLKIWKQQLSRLN